MIIKYSYDHEVKYDGLDYELYTTELCIIGFEFELDTEKNSFIYKSLSVADIIGEELSKLMNIPPSLPYSSIKLSDDTCKEIEDISANFLLVFEIVEDYMNITEGCAYEIMSVKIPEHKIEIRFGRQRNTTLNNPTENSMYVFENILSDILIKEDIEFTLNKLVVKGEEIQ